MEFPKPFRDFPRKENCDPNNPYQAFLWMLVALPYQNGGALVMPIDYMQLVSKRLWDLGCRPTEQPTLEWVAPTATEPNWITSPGRWVPAGSAPVKTEEQNAEDALENMPMQQQAELFSALQCWEAGEEMPDTAAGVVANQLTDGQKETLLSVLRARRDSAG